MAATALVTVAGAEGATRAVPMGTGATALEGATYQIAAHGDAVVFGVRQASSRDGRSGESSLSGWAHAAQRAWPVCCQRLLHRPGDPCSGSDWHTVGCCVLMKGLVLDDIHVTGFVCSCCAA